jgi:hypothetical protein
VPIQDFKLGGALNFFWGYFVWKITILRHQIIFFPILGGVRRVRPPPPVSAPAITTVSSNLDQGEVYNIMW